MHSLLFTIQSLSRRKLVLLVVALLMLVTVFAEPVADRAAAAPIKTPVSLTTFADAATQCDRSFFGLRAWFYYMPNELGVPQRGDTPGDPCAVRCFNIFPQQKANDCGQKSSDIPAIILAVVDDLLRIAGLVAVIFVIIGAFQFVGSRGNAERTASAQSTVIGALVGLAISMAAVGIVAFIGNRLQ